MAPQIPETAFLASEISLKAWCQCFEVLTSLLYHVCTPQDDIQLLVSPLYSLQMFLPTKEQYDFIHAFLLFDQTF